MAGPLFFAVSLIDRSKIRDFTLYALTYFWVTIEQKYHGLYASVWSAPPSVCIIAPVSLLRIKRAGESLFNVTARARPLPRKMAAISLSVKLSSFHGIDGNSQK